MKDHSGEWPILVVTKDKAEFLIYSRVVEALRKLGYRVYVIAEGLSMQEWVNIGEKLYRGAGILDPKGFRHDIDVPTVFEELNPRLVLTGLGAPINLGEKFGLEAKRRSIKLGYIEDLWGVHRRSKAVPNFICTLDSYGETSIRRHIPYHDKDVEVHVTGNPALDRLRDIDPRVIDYLGIYNHDVSIVLAGQDESTTSVIDGLLGAVRVLTEVGKGVLVIPRLHPKFMREENLKRHWLNQLHEMGQICTVMSVPTSVEIAQLAGQVQFVVSTYSGALIEAAVMGALPVSWVSSVGQEKMLASIGQVVFPLVTLSCAAQVTTPEDFVALIYNTATSEHLKQKAREIYPKICRMDKVVNVINSYL